MDVFLKKYFWIFYLLVITCCGLLLGKTIDIILGGTLLAVDSTPMKAPSNSTSLLDSTTKRDISPILSRNIFCANCEPLIVAATPNAPSALSAIADSNPQRTSLQLQLVALMPSSDQDWSMAVIRDLSDEKKSVSLYKRSDSMHNGQAQVLQITDQKVYLAVGSKIEYLDYTNLPNPAPGPIATLPLSINDPNAAEKTALDKEIDKGVRCNNNNCEIERSTLDKVLGNTTALATSARIIPFPGGFKIYPIGQNSVWGKIGIKSGDVVKSINGLEMSSPDKVLEIYAKLRTASHISLVVDRGGSSVTMDYTIR